MKYVNYVLPILCCLLVPCVSNADFYEYTFIGTLPDGASTHSMVNDGEVWTAVFVIDSEIEDSNTAEGVGLYDGAVVSGTLEFSGGYVAESTNFSGATVFALNDIFSADSVRIRGESGVSDFIFQANSEDLTTLNTEALPTPGVAFDPFPDEATFEYFQLTFDDEFGSINYFANAANNVSFSAAAASIPEPSSTVALILAGCFAIRRRTR